MTIEENLFLVSFFKVGHQLSRFENMYELDVVFDSNFEKIEASRFLIVVENATSSSVQQILRQIAKNSEIPGVRVFNMQAILGDEVEVLLKIVTCILKS